MKNLLFGLIATVLFSFTGNAQSIKDFLVKSQTSISQTSADGFYKNYVSKIILPKGIQLINNNSYTLYTLNDVNFKMIEIPVLSDTKIVNFMFIIINVNLNTSKIIYKNHQKGNYQFFDENLEKTYTLTYTDRNISFVNQTGTASRTCYSACRANAYAAIEGDWLSDLACSLNPCGAVIAIYCGAKCS